MFENLIRLTLTASLILVPASQSIAAPALAAPAAQNAQFAETSRAFLDAYWRALPDAAIGAGKFDEAARQDIPDAASRQRTREFAATWTARLAQIDGATLPPSQRSDLLLIKNELASIAWNLDTFRSYTWNPAEYNMSESLDAIFNADYAPLEARLRAISQRLANGPAYYSAALANIANQTSEHTRLAIAQLPGAGSLLDSIGKAAQASQLTASEKETFALRLQQNHAAIDTYVAALTALERQAPANARPFRIGKALYDAKFGYDIQSGFNAEQTYSRALLAKEELLQRMQQLTQQLWPKYLGNVAKPEGRTRQIKMLIDKMSENHVARGELFAEVRRQIPQLEQWVTSHDLLTLDPSHPLIVRETPVYKRGVAGASIDAPGPFQAQRATYYNVTPIDDETPEQAESFLREYNQWMMQILNMHEAVPGHYVQLIHSNRSPSLIKSVFSNGAMIEGWAVYGERMMLESGYGGDTPEMWLMWSKWNLRSVTNTILDYSVHVLDMSEADVKSMLVNQAFQSDNEANGKWRRLQLTSVQLTSYFSGYTEIMALRDEQKKSLGAQFDQKKFHETFLSFGAAPVNVIRSLMQP